MDQPPPNNRPHPLTEMVDELARYLDALHDGMRKRFPKGRHALWADAASEGLYSALEEIRVAHVELQRARDEAESERQRYHELFDSAPDGYLITDQYGKILELNRVAARMLNITSGYIIGKPMIVYLSSPDRKTFFRAIGDLLKRNQIETECTLTLMPRQQAPPIDVHCRAAAVRGWNTVLTSIRWLMRDVTSAKRIQAELTASREQLKALAAEAAQAEDRERRRIAEGVHDNAVQTLALASMTLSSALRGIPEPQAATVREGVRLVSHAIEELRTLIFDLAPPVLYELGLGPAVEWLADQFERRHGMAIEVRNDVPASLLPIHWRVPLFQSVRELLINALKHAHATRIAVTVRPSSRGIRISVIDNGRGIALINLRKPDAHVGFGLFSLRNRLEHLGGRVRIRSAPNRGTCIKLLVPLSPDLLQRARAATLDGDNTRVVSESTAHHPHDQA